jgi:hypothetical protein
LLPCIRYYKTIPYLDARYIVLSDACHGFSVPCGSDIKVGTLEVCSLDRPEKHVEYQKKVKSLVVRKRSV